MRNPFPAPSALDRVLLKELVDVARMCYDRGWSHGTAGNFSLRSHDIVWQSPTGWCKGKLNAKDFIAVDLETEMPVNPSSNRPSAEMPVHLGIYKAVEAAKCVVHTHPLKTVKASFEKKKLTFQNREMQKALSSVSHVETLDIILAENQTPDDMKTFSAKIKKHVQQNIPMVVLAGHGVYAWGKSPMQALSYIEALEFLCAEL